MTTVRFVVAKYIADRRRMEPKNIGVIAWQDGAVYGRFAGEANGTIKPPRSIDRGARKAYMSVVESWRLQFDKQSIPIGRGRDDVTKASPEFLQAIARYSQENFIIVDGGHVSAIASGATLPSVVDNLFGEIVDGPELHEKRRQSSLTRLCDKLLAPLSGNSDFHSDGFSIPHQDFPFSFSYAFGEKENPVLLMQAVSLANPDQVTSAAMKFRCVSEDSRVVTREKCASLVDDSHGKGPNARRLVTFLSRYSEIVSLSNLNTAALQLARLGLPLAQTMSS